MRLINPKFRPKWTYILFVVMLFIMANSALAQNDQNPYRRQLKEVILERRLGRSGVFSFLSSGASLNTPPGFYPITGLHDPNAIPFLLDVFQNGPDWSEDELPRGTPREKADIYRYVARCYAALSLGYIGDSRAFDPLLAVLNNKNVKTQASRLGSPKSDDYNLRAYAAFALGYLGDQRAVNPLIKSLREDGFIECIYALARLEAITSVPVIVQVASDRKMFGNFAINRCLEYMLKVRFTSRTAGKDRIYQIIDQFPELGTVHVSDKRRIVWQHWIKAGDKFAKERFEQYYPQWKAALKDKPNAHGLHRDLKERMLSGGIAALPYLIAEMEKGDSSLVPVAAKLTRPRIRRVKDLSPELSENAKQADALKWWQKNKQKWTVFQTKTSEK